METIQITYQGIKIQVSGIYSRSIPSNDYDVPSDPSTFDIEEVTYKGEDVTELFNIIDEYEEIEILVLNEIER